MNRRLALVFLGFLAIGVSAQIDEDPRIDPSPIPSGCPEDSFLKALCHVKPWNGSAVEGYIYLCMKDPSSKVKIMGTLWGLTEENKHYELEIHANALYPYGNCDSAGDTLMGAVGIDGHIETLKGHGSAGRNNFHELVSDVTLEAGVTYSLINRSIVVTSKQTRDLVGCCTIVYN